MAKYTDPNTGVKYSTHTGLKVFAVIVVILLAISIVLNVVLYTQNSDVSETDDGTDEELYGDGYNDGDEDGDGEESDDGHDFPELENGDEEEDGVVIVDNENAVRTSGFDENGVATCTYYYPSKNYVDYDGSDLYGCWYCHGECEGHDRYITTGGGVYDFYPDTIDEYQLEAADGSETDINSKIKVALIFELDWRGRSVQITDLGYGNMYPSAIEISSLTGEPLEIESYDNRQYIYCDGSVEYHSKAGADRTGTLREESTDYTLIYGSGGYPGQFTVTITMKDGGAYTFEYWACYEKGLTVKNVD